MSLASLSTEAIIRERLRELGCAENSFAAFNGVVGRTRFFEAMRGEPGRHFSQQDAERLLATISEMEELESKSDPAINWGQTDRVLRALVVLRIERYAAELTQESAKAAQNQ
jgi:hypothetical protein